LEKLLKNTFFQNFTPIENKKSSFGYATHFFFKSMSFCFFLVSVLMKITP
jgi:hypothetical protein